MNKLSLKSKILFLLFAASLSLSAIFFNFEQVILAIVALIITLIFAVLLAIEAKEGLK